MNYNTLKNNGELLKQLDDLMAIKKAYQDEHCSLTSLAKKIGVPKRKVSELIRDNFGKSFTSFLNDYRLAEVLERFKTKDVQKHTILAIALESGFPSKSTFYRYFKNHLGIPPSEFISNKPSKP